MASVKNSSKSQSKSQGKKSQKKEEYSKERQLFWYENMLLVRRFEEKAVQLYSQQKFGGFCHLYIGQEACSSGAVTALKEGDKWITAYRDHGLPIALGMDAKYVMAELLAKNTGCAHGKGGSMHMFSRDYNFFGGHGIVGNNIPLGTGLGFAEQYRKTDNLAINFFGDGAVRQGAFHESLNMAMMWKLPVIYCIENNGYAMGTAVNRQSNVTDLHELACAYEMPSAAVNGMRPEDVHEAVSEAAERARKGEGPTLLELKTYRYKGHSISDPATYRTKEELQYYKEQDPIIHTKSEILDKGYATEDELKEIDQKVKDNIKEAVKFAEESPLPDPSEAYQDVYVQQDYPFIHE